MNEPVSLYNTEITGSIPVGKSMNSLVILIGDDSIHIDVFHAAEDILLNLRINLFKLRDEVLYLQTL